MLEAHSVSAGLDYPGVGPRARLAARRGPRALRGRARRGRARGLPARWRELEGIIPALEPAHALAWLLANPAEGLDVLVLSGRGDKDLAEVLAR